MIIIILKENVSNMWTGLQTSAHGSTRWHSLQISSSQMQITLALIKQVYRSLFLLITFFKLKVRLSSTFSLILPSLLFHLPSATTFSLILPPLLFHLHLAITISLILPSLLFHLHLTITISLILPSLLFHLHSATTISLILPSLNILPFLSNHIFSDPSSPIISSPLSNHYFSILPSLLFHLHLAITISLSFLPYYFISTQHHYFSYPSSP